MNDIRPSRRPSLPPRERPSSAGMSAAPPQSKSDLRSRQQAAAALASEQPLSARPFETPVKKKASLKKWLLAAFGLVLIVAVACLVGVYSWYQSQLSAVNPDSTKTERLIIESGMGPKAIAALLEEKKLIKNSLAFEWYVRMNDSENSLQAGAYALSQSMPVSEIAEHLQSGKTDTISITFYPGGTLTDTTDKPEAQKTDVTTVLKRAGYSEQAITQALKKEYDSPLFASKPASADLEGYIYGETYQFSAAASVEEILQRTFDQMYTVVKDNDLETKFKAQGLTLYEGITLASIVQREVPTAGDQKAVARVFLNRLAKDMSLGSDVTYQYIADKTGVARDPDLDSPYNTRRYEGLPPGPIAAPSESALVAVADPADNDYLFFLSGDDDKTYFATTQAGHEKNIVEHCQQKCQIL